MEQQQEVIFMARANTKQVVGLGLITAIVIVLQFLGSFIKFGPFSVSLVLIPIVVGAALYGAKAGAWLGFVFGIVVLISGDAGLFLAVDAAAAVITVLLKGTLAGLGAGIVYKSVERLNRYVAVAASAIICPVINTGIFLLGCKLFFMKTVTEWATGMGFADAGTYMIVSLAGLNFVFELLINVIISPVTVRLIALGKKEHQ